MDENFDKIKIAKSVTKFVATHSVGFVLTKAIGANVPITTQREQVQLVIGSFVIGSMVKEKAGEWTDRQFDKALVGIKALAKTIEKETTDIEE